MCHRKVFIAFKVQAHGDFYTCRHFLSRKQISNSFGFKWFFLNDDLMEFSHVCIAPAKSSVQYIYIRQCFRWYLLIHQQESVSWVVNRLLGQGGSLWVDVWVPTHTHHMSPCHTPLSTACVFTSHVLAAVHIQDFTHWEQFHRPLPTVRCQTDQLPT